MEKLSTQYWYPGPQMEPACHYLSLILLKKVWFVKCNYKWFRNNCSYYFTNMKYVFTCCANNLCVLLSEANGAWLQIHKSCPLTHISWQLSEDYTKILIRIQIQIQIQIQTQIQIQMNYFANQLIRVGARDAYTPTKNLESLSSYIVHWMTRTKFYK